MAQAETSSPAGQVRRSPSLAERQAPPGLELLLNYDVARQLRPHAARRDMTTVGLAMLIVDMVAEHGLIDAVLDDARGELAPGATERRLRQRVGELTEETRMLREQLRAARRAARHAYPPRNGRRSCSTSRTGTA